MSSQENSYTLANERQATATLFQVFLMLSLTAYFGLTVTFEFPDILRKDANDILRAFEANEIAVRSFYYLFAVSHLILALAIVAAHRSLRALDSLWLTFATAGGVLYALAQSVGFLRWPFLVPMFTDLPSGADPVQVLLILESFHRFAGVAIGENLSFLGLSLWLVGMGAILRPHHAITGMIWVGVGLLVFVYSLEQIDPAFSFLSPLLIITHGIMYGLILLLSFSLKAMRDQDEALPPVGRIKTLGVVLACALLIIPAFM